MGREAVGSAQVAGGSEAVDSAQVVVEKETVDSSQLAEDNEPAGGSVGLRLGVGEVAGEEESLRDLLALAQALAPALAGPLGKLRERRAAKMIDYPGASSWRATSRARLMREGKQPERPHETSGARILKTVGTLSLGA